VGCRRAPEGFPDGTHDSFRRFLPQCSTLANAVINENCSALASLSRPPRETWQTDEQCNCSRGRRRVANPSRRAATNLRKTFTLQSVSFIASYEDSRAPDSVPRHSRGVRRGIPRSPPFVCLSTSAFLSSRVPADLRCLSLVRCGTSLVADVEVRSRCLLSFFRRSVDTKSYTSTAHNQTKAHKYFLRWFMFATEGS